MAFMGDRNRALFGMTNIEVDIDCKVRFNCYNLIVFLKENK